MISVRMLGAALVVGVAIAAGTGVASAEDAAAVGWWWKGRPTAGVPALPAPMPDVPEGGLYVAGDVTGPSGVSALRITIAPEATAPVLTLTIEGLVGTATVNACATSSAWEPVERGGWDDRPEADCEAGLVPGTVDVDAGEIRFDLAPLTSDTGDVDVVLVPGVDAATDQPATFSVTFAAPDDRAITTSPAPDVAPTDAAFDDVSVDPEPYVAPSFNTPSVDLPSLVEPPVGPQAQEAAVTELPRRVATSVTAGGYAYPAVLALPLALLVAASYFGWALTRPVVITRAVRA